MAELKYLDDVSTLQLDAGGCIGCGMCVTVCPHAVFTLAEGKAAINDHNRCMECGACAKNCPVEVITVKAGVGCASAIIYSWLTGKEPRCDCSDGDGGCC
ncbi:MAG: mercury methylation ferredoxin HgcB [Desulfuromonadales bacterium]|nr:mercury methylation ferredoxin HgcB [Desulfuromonadales bacterium]